MIYIISFLLANHNKNTRHLRIVLQLLNFLISRIHPAERKNALTLLLILIILLKYIILLFTAINIINTDANIIKPITLHNIANDLHNFISIDN